MHQTIDEFCKMTSKVSNLNKIFKSIMLKGINYFQVSFSPVIKQAKKNERTIYFLNIWVDEKFISHRIILKLVYYLILSEIK